MVSQIPFYDSVFFHSIMFYRRFNIDVWQDQNVKKNPSKKD